MAQRNQVRGPTSALTSFLRERGIRAPRHAFPRRQQAAPPAAQANAPEPAPIAANHNERQPVDNPIVVNDDAPPIPTEEVDETVDRAGSDQELDELEKTDAEERNATNHEDKENSDDEALVKRKAKTQGGKATKKAKTSGVKPPSSKASKFAAASSSRSSKAKKPPPKKSKNDDDESSSEDNGADDHDPLNGVLPKPSNKLAPRSAHTKRKTNAFSGGTEFCNNCKRRFIPNHGDPTLLCPACLVLGLGGGSKPRHQVKRKKKNAANVVEDSGERLMSLKDICIRMVAENIDDVEDFGNIPDDTKFKISRILSRNRTLDARTVNLFLGADERQLELFDCSRLDENALKSIAHMTPHLTRLNLSFCGRMTDAAMKEMTDRCTMITSLHLAGPFLVNDAAFAALFKSLGTQLVHVHLEHAAKLGMLGIQALAEHCTKLQTLALANCRLVGSDIVDKLVALTMLEALVLDALGDAVKGVEDGVLVRVLKAVGAHLRILKLENFPDMTDAVLTEGITGHCPIIRRLSLKCCSSLSSDAFVSFFSSNKLTSPFTHLSLHRCANIEDKAITALINMHGSSLEVLSLNGLDNLTEYSLRELGECCKLRELDASWVRSLDDEIFESILDRCGEIGRSESFN